MGVNPFSFSDCLEKKLNITTTITMVSFLLLPFFSIVSDGDLLLILTTLFAMFRSIKSEQSLNSQESTAAAVVDPFYSYHFNNTGGDQIEKERQCSKKAVMSDCCYLFNQKSENSSVDLSFSWI